MSFRVLPNGSIEVGTLEDAIRLSQMLAGNQPATTPASGPRAPEPPAAPSAPVRGGRGRVVPPATQVDAETAWATFVSLVIQKPLQVKALRRIREHGVITISELRDLLNLENNYGMSGVMAGVTKNVNKSGIDGNLLLTSERDHAGVMTYTAGPLLLEKGDML